MVLDAEHYEDARDKIRSHFRTDHPKKVFNKHLLENDYETYNLTLEEYFANGYPGTPMALLSDRQVVAGCTRIRQSARSFNPDIVQEAITLAGEHGEHLAPWNPNAEEPPGGYLFYDELLPQERGEIFDDHDGAEPF